MRISKRSAVAEKVYIVVKWAVNLSRPAGYGSELFLKLVEHLHLSDICICSSAVLLSSLSPVYFRDKPPQYRPNRLY